MTDPGVAIPCDTFDETMRVLRSGKESLTGWLNRSRAGTEGLCPHWRWEAEKARLGELEMLIARLDALTPPSPPPGFDARTAEAGSKWLTRQGLVLTFDAYYHDVHLSGRACRFLCEQGPPAFRSRFGRIHTDGRTHEGDIIAPAPCASPEPGTGREVERCEHCGSDRIYSGPPDCPGCGAPNCCQTCCKIASQDAEIERLKSRSLSCCFCDEPCDSLSDLKGHSETCEAHPAVVKLSCCVTLAKRDNAGAEARIDQLESDIAAAREENGRLRDCLQGALDFAGEPLVRHATEYAKYRDAGYAMLREPIPPLPPAPAATAEEPRIGSVSDNDWPPTASPQQIATNVERFLKDNATRQAESVEMPCRDDAESMQRAKDKFVKPSPQSPAIDLAAERLVGSEEPDESKRTRAKLRSGCIARYIAGKWTWIVESEGLPFVTNRSGQALTANRRLDILAIIPAGETP